MGTSSPPANEWGKLTRRLQLCGDLGRVVVASVVCVIVNGRLRHWTCPTVKKIEPAGNADRFIELLADLNQDT